MHAGKFDLQDSFARLRAGGENIENDLLPVDDTKTGLGLPVALLPWCEIIVENDTVAFLHACLVDDFTEFSWTNEKSRLGSAHWDRKAASDDDAQGPDEFLEFGERRKLGFRAHRAREGPR